jgi:hypothetical protein
MTGVARSIQACLKFCSTSFASFFCLISIFSENLVGPLALHWQKSWQNKKEKMSLQPLGRDNQEINLFIQN